MKALTLTEPWATLVATGSKQIETRSWRASYRGPLAIHAAKGLGPVGGKEGFRGLCFSEPFLSALTSAKPNAGGMFYHEDYFFSLPFGAIIATCDLVGIVSTRQLLATPIYEWESPQGRIYRYELTEKERAFGNYATGRWAWLLADVRRLPEPITMPGKLGLWECEVAL